MQFIYLSYALPFYLLLFSLSLLSFYGLVLWGSHHVFVLIGCQLLSHVLALPTFNNNNRLGYKFFGDFPSPTKLMSPIALCLHQAFTHATGWFPLCSALCWFLRYGCRWCNYMFRDQFNSYKIRISSSEQLIACSVVMVQLHVQRLVWFLQDQNIFIWTVNCMQCRRFDFMISKLSRFSEYEYKLLVRLLILLN